MPDILHLLLILSLSKLWELAKATSVSVYYQDLKLGPWHSAVDFRIMLSTSNIFTPSQWQILNSSWLSQIITSHHPLDLGMHMLRIANYVFLPTLWFYPHNIFLSVLICFLARTVLRQKGNILYLYCNMLNPFISACFFFHCFYAAFNRNSNTFPSFLQKKKIKKIYWIYKWVFKHNFKIH